MDLQNKKGGPEEPPLFGAISDQINQLSFHSTEEIILINTIEMSTLFAEPVNTGGPC